MTPEEKAEKWYEDNFPIFEAADVCLRDFVKAYLAGYAEGEKKPLEIISNLSSDISAMSAEYEELENSYKSGSIYIQGIIQAVERERERILFEFEEPHQIEYELDVTPLVVRDFFTGNEWVTIQLIVKGKRNRVNKDKLR